MFVDQNFEKARKFIRKANESIDPSMKLMLRRAILQDPDLAEQVKILNHDQESDLYQWAVFASRPDISNDHIAHAN